jgi:hypothetical protein
MPGSLSSAMCEHTRQDSNAAVISCKQHEQIHTSGSRSSAALEHARQEQHRSRHVLQAAYAHTHQQGSLSSAVFACKASMSTHISKAA